MSIVPIEVLDWPGARAIVSAGLNGGELIIAAPSALVDGDRVRLFASETAAER